ncbi:MAG: PaaI family thioesterase [Desulfobulbus sp.]|nr:PaaI family thioesterase [Desulfobulbus sp.]
MNIVQEKLRLVNNIPDQTCFGCGTNNPIGLKMQFKTDDEKLYSFVTVPRTMAGWDTTVHGGILSTILDEMMGWSVIYLLGKIGVTKAMTVEFLKPVPAETPLTAIGFIQEVVSERQVLVTGEIYNQDSVLCVRSTGTFAAMTSQAAVRLGVMSSDYMERFLPLLTQKERGANR